MNFKGNLKRSLATSDKCKQNGKSILTSNESEKSDLADKLKPKSKDLSKSAAVDAKKPSSVDKGAKYEFRLEDHRPVPLAININNWALVLRNERQKEVLNIWMRKIAPSITVQSPVDGLSDGQLTSGYSPKGASSVPSWVPPVTRPFLQWPILDDFGELDPLDLDDRCQRFLRAFLLDLPVPISMSKEERARRPRQASAQRVIAKATVSVAGKNLAEVRDKIKADGKNACATEICDKFEELLRLFLPDQYVTDSGSDPIQLYWGAVYVINSGCDPIQLYWGAVYVITV